MSAVTAKVVVSNRIEHKKNAEGEVYNVAVSFYPDYADGRNKEWAFATPSLSLTMNVRPEVAQFFPLGQKFTLTFEPEA